MHVYGIVGKTYDVWFESEEDLDAFRLQCLTAATDPGTTILNVIPKGTLKKPSEVSHKTLRRQD